MRLLFLSTLFLASLVVALFAFMPIGSILKLAGAEARGLTWEQASGTLRQGQLTGLRLNDESLGSARLKLEPAAFMSGGISYAANWEGPAGRGTGTIGAYPGNRIVFSDLRAEFDLTALRGMANWVRQTGGMVRIRTDKVTFRDGRCESAMGTAWSDALVRGGAILGTTLPELSGKLMCDSDWLIIPLGANAANGMAVDIRGRMNLVAPGSFEARVSGSIPTDVRIGLPLAGFAPSGRDFVYTYSAALERPSQ